MKKLKLLPVLIFIANAAFTQVANVSPNSLNANVTQCFDSVTQQFTIGNTDANSLTYNNIAQAYGFDDTKAGKVFSSFNNIYARYGMVIVGDILYGVNSNRIYKHNINTGAYLGNSYAHSNSRSIVYDGQYLWIGNNTGLLRSYNLNGNATGNSIQLPFSDYEALAWDGEYFIASDYNQTNPTIYKIDKNGTIIETYTSNVGCVLYSYTWVEKHAEGHLWAIGSNNKIMQLALNGTVFEVANQFTKQSNFWVYSIFHDGTNLLHTNSSSILFKFDDGILEADNYINFSSNTGTVTGNSSQHINIEFNAKNINAGVYNADVIVKTNDPVNPKDTITCTFTVVGNPTIVTQTSLLHGNVFINDTKIDTLTVYNTGCDTLKITNITSSNGVFTTNITQTNVLPHDSLYLKVEFTPTAETGYNGTLTIYNNDVNTAISLSGTGVAAPALTVSTDSLNAEVTVCFDSTTQQFTINNTGNGILTFENNLQTYGFDNTKAGYVYNIKNSVNCNYGIIIVGNYIYGVNSGNTLYKYNKKTGSHIISYNIHPGIFSIIYDGQYLWIGDNTGKLRSYDLNGNATGNLIQLPFSNYTALAWDGEYFITSNRNQYNPTIYKVDKGGNIIETYSSNAGCYLRSYTWVEKHAEGHLWAIGSNNKIMQLALNGTVFEVANQFTKPSGFWDYSITHDGTNLLHVSNNNTLSKFNDGVVEAENWVNLSNNNGSIAGNSSQQIDIEFNAKNINAGIHTVDLLINTDDPLNRVDTISCAFTVEGNPTIVVPKSSLAYGNVFVNDTITDTITVYNTGCDTLKITNIISSNGVFITNITQADILPHDSLYLKVEFTPTAETGYNGTLTIYNNDINTAINLSGMGIGSPEFSVNVDTISVIVTECNDLTTKQFTINNTGNGLLTFEDYLQAYGFDNTKAGNIYSTFNNVYGYYGITIVGKYLYTVVWGNRLYKYNLTTGRSVWGKNIHSSVWSIVFDGQYLWIGDNTGKLRSYDLNGNATGNSIQLPFSNYSALAWDGEYFITSNRDQYNPTIYKVNKSGDVIETYTTNINARLYSYTWVEKHAEGHLWAIGSNNKIMQLTLNGTVFEVANQFTKPNGFWNYSLTHDGTNLLHVNGSYHLQTFDDGVLEAENWLSLSAESGTVGISSSQQIDAVFKSENIDLGTYKADIIIKSDDPLNRADTIVCTFTANGNPELIVSEESFDFGDVWVAQTNNKTFTITNTGCDTLKVSGITSNQPEFTANMNTFDILPSNSSTVTVTFAPTAYGMLNTELTIATNAGDSVINLTGNGLAPIITDITTLKPDGYYKTGEAIDFLVDFDMNVDVTGTPRIKLNTQPTTYANYIGGSGTAQLIFQYTVIGNEDSDDLDYTTVDDLTLNGGTIKHNVSGARLTLPLVGTISDIKNIVIDNTKPETKLSSVTPNPTNGLITVAVNFGEIVTGFEMSDIVVGNGTPSNLKTSNSGARYTFDIEALTEDDVTIDVAADVAQDLAGNTNIIATQLIVKFDNTRPTVSLSSNTSNSKGDNTISLIIRFSEDVNGLTISDFAVGNGAATNLATINPARYTVDILPTAIGVVTVDIPANAVKDLAQNGNIEAEQFSTTSSSISPTVVLSTTSTSPTNDNPIVTTVEFSETVTGFELSDIKVANGVASNLVAITAGKKFKIDVIPDGEGKVTISLDANKAENSGGNGNTQATPLSIYYDATAPSVQLSTNEDSPTSNETIGITIDFDESVTGFTVSDLTVDNGTAGNFKAVSEKQYTADITPAADGNVTVGINAAVATDKAGNSNTAATQLSITFDKTGPTATISSTVTGTTNKKPVTITIEFNEKVADFQLSNMTVGNGYVTSLVELTEGTSYEASLYAYDEAEVTVDILAGAVTDIAGNGNSAASQYSITYDGTSPSVVISTSVSDLTNSSPIGVIIDFSEAVSGFELTDLVVGNGTASNFVEVNTGTKFTADITPTAVGIVTVDITAYSATDNAGNNNTAATQLSVNYNNEQPSVVISSQTNNLTSDNPISIRIDFAKEVSGFDLSDITIGNGTADNLVEVITGKQFTADITPSEGTVTANIAAGVATDAAGNGNTAATQFSRTYDGTSPVASISTTAVSPTNSNAIDITIEFTEEVNGFGLQFIYMGNATGTNFVEVETGLKYTATAVPNADGEVTLYIADNVTHDAAGNGNIASGSIVIEYEGTAPILTNITLNGVTANKADFTFSSHKSGNVYYQVLLTTTTPPTVDDVLGNLGDSVVTSGNFAIVNEVENELTATGLSAGESYTLYMVTNDDLGNKSPIYKIDFSTNFVDISDTENINIQVYPNPNSGVFQIDLSNNDITGAFITVHDLKGNKIANISLTEQKQTIDLGEQPNGVYFVQVHLQNEVFTHRFVIE